MDMINLANSSEFYLSVEIQQKLSSCRKFSRLRIVCALLITNYSREVLFINDKINKRTVYHIYVHDGLIIN